MDKQLSNERVRGVWEHHAVGSHQARAEAASPAYFEHLRNYRYGYEHPWLPRLFRFHELQGKRVLEIGIGTGLDAVSMAQNGADYTGLDITRNHLDLTRENFAINAPNSSYRIVEGDLTATTLEGPFDVVYSFGVLHHIHHEDEYLRRIWELLRPGGRLLVGLYARTSFFNVYLFVTWLLRLKFLRCSFAAWQSHVAEGSPIDAPVVIKIRSRGEIVRLYEHAGFKLVRYYKRGFVQNNLPLIGKWFHPDGPTLNFLGSLLGWYHLCEFEKVAQSPVARS